jgi:hypothetical protein
MSKPIPFIFARIRSECQHNPHQYSMSESVKDWVVKIAHPDFATYMCEWMDDPEMGKWAYTPDVDLTKEEHVFPDYQSAREFVKTWWMNND